MGVMSMKRLQLSDHFTIANIILFALPSIGMQLVDNTYQVADGYFISNFIGISEFAAENMIFPPLSIVACIGLMFGSGASALISYELGQQNKERAKRLMTMLILILALLGVVVSALLFILMPSLARMVGATDNLVPHCVTYGRILAIFMPFQMLSSSFHPLLVVEERPGMGLFVSIANAVVNIVLDGILVAVLSMGLRGAALATGIAWFISALIPIIYFLKSRKNLYFVNPLWELRSLLKVLYNGASEMVDAVSYALVAVVFNYRLIKYAGESGVAAYAVTEFVAGLFTAIFFGVAMSMTPVVGYHHGENNKTEIRSILKNGFTLMGVCGVVMALLCFTLATVISSIFVKSDANTMSLSVAALRFAAIAFLFGGLTTFGSGFFTGMGDGTSSLIVAAMKSFVLPLSLVLLLPLFMGVMGIWLVTPVAEVCTTIVVVVILIIYRKKNTV
jgi:putative MATE family efflux protein